MSSTCSNCGFHNPAGMHFCGKCGSRLADPTSADVLTVDSAISSLNAEETLIGSNLIERFRQAGMESAGQRRTVTVLFADLCDYTGLTEKIDDEELYDVIQLFIRMLAEKVYQYEGMVDKITGDGLIALFGAPIAFENPAERAVRSALDMMVGLQNLNKKFEDRLGEKLQMHIGINRGTVIVGGVSADLLIDYTAIGNTVNLARRLQEAAPSDSVLVSESVYSATQALFDFHMESGLTLKGYRHVLDGYRLVGVKSQPGLVRGLQGLHSPMIGREAEFANLVDALQDLAHYKRGQLVVVCGEAGIGKSRLTAEFKSNISLEEMTMLEGQSLTYRRSVSYWIFQEILRDYLGVSTETPASEVRDRLVTNVTQTMGPEAEDVLPFLENVLAIASSDGSFLQRLSYLEAEQLRQQTFIAIRDFLIAEARNRPMVLILEDLHWADEVSLDLLSFLLDSLDNSPLMVLAISRPPLEGKLGEILTLSEERLQERCRFLRLQNLSEEQSDRLLFGLLGIKDMPQNFRLQILARAAGVPFFLEEILRMLIDKQLLVFEDGKWIFSPGDNEALDVPDNLQDLILTRFDRLDPLQRSVLQTASVIGKEFNTTLLKEVLTLDGDMQIYRALSSLVEKAFILPYPDQGDDAYLFRHVLTSDAVYRTLLRRDRNRLHGNVAESLEKVYADRLESQVEVLAGHYLRSNYLDKALYYQILAGNKSSRDYANLQARKHFENARDLLSKVSHTPEQAQDVWTGLGDVLVFIGEYVGARQSYQEALEAIRDSQASSASQAHSVIHRKIAITYERLGDFEKALAHLKVADEVLLEADIDSPVSKAQILNDTGWIFFLRGSFDQSQETLLTALDLVEGVDHYGVIASIHNRLGAVAYQLREYDQAAKHVQKSLDLRKTLGDLSGEARLYNNLGLLGLMSGDLRQAESNFHKSIELIEKVGDAEGIALAYINLGLVKYERGNYGPAEVHLVKAQSVAEKIGHRFYLALAEMYLGRLQTAINQYNQAAKSLFDSIELFEDLGAQDNLIDAMCYLSENHLAMGDLKGSIRWIDKAHEILIGTQGDLSEDSVQSGRVLRLQGAIARLQGDLERANQLLLESAEIFSAAYEKLESARSAYELGLLAIDQADYPNAQKFFNDARVLFDEMGAGKEIHRVDSLMEKLTV